jgi:hypothetical protein
MRHAAAFLIITVSACLALTLPPFFFECSLVDRVAVSARVGNPVALVALGMLERVAEGRVAGLSPEVEVQVGLQPGQLHKPEFKDEGVRSHALRRIGEVDLPEALAYLQNLKKGDIQPDVSGRMWSSAQIALRQGQVNRIPDETGKISFLEGVTSDRASAAAGWAVQELCNRGSNRSLGFISGSIRRRDSTPRGLVDVSFCEAPMAIISRDPDRSRALGSFLSVYSGETDSQVPLKVALRIERVQIQRLLPQRPK